ncbi:hypothetical protein M758_7G134700 [Ceratodon purpureus]|uniref:Uncharacterized protein n=1 Tax=Ceratodon purpureus TaxID=3225 RepID=A0A8T0HAZ5_CERPU|nr:hypothetical protein KC19_7G143200 [Ceratodon purpureus]KAG0611349.1 hypothetical protein M758_7G134700 [Ceratodon purpureus]
MCFWIVVCQFSVLGLKFKTFGFLHVVSNLRFVVDIRKEEVINISDTFCRLFSCLIS